MKYSKNLEKEYIHEKKWMYQGEATAQDRPVNSLLDLDIDFRQAQSVAKTTAEEEDEILFAVKQRLRENNFDNFVFSKLENIEKDEEMPVENQNILTIAEIEDMMNDLTKDLLLISDMNNNITNTKETQKKLENKRKSKVRKTNIVNQLKKHKNVQFIP